MRTKMAVAFANIFMTKIESENTKTELQKTASVEKIY